MHGILKMPRIADMPIPLPAGVEVNVQPGTIAVKGQKGQMDMPVHELVQIAQKDQMLKVSPRSKSKKADIMCGTTRSLVANMVQGVSEGFEKKLTISGVGYRVHAQGKKLNMALGFSHPVLYELPEGVDGEVPSQTEIILRSMDKQKVGQVAAEIRALQPLEPYKGKGIRYVDERVKLKEAKKK